MQQIQLINTLDSIAKVSAKDCIISNNKVVFLIPEDAIKKAIGKKGSNVRMLAQKLKKKVELFEYAEEPKTFLEKAFSKVRIEKVKIKEVRGKKIMFVKTEPESKGIILRNLGRLKSVKE
ncbi:MAG: NusA-like transcription termination signal-binding factor, partial [Candidatus Diapherotrites archaeon]